MQKYDYRFTDNQLKIIKAKIARRFSRFKALASFDEINLLENANVLFDELEADAEEMYMKIARHYARLFDKENKITKKWLNGYLTSYNPVTTYQYAHEVDRKKYRMFEAYMATKLVAEIDKCMKLWTIQVSQASVDITDKAIVDMAKLAGYKWVMWLTEEDDRVCKTCEPRDKKIYPIDKAPDKPHYNCRCILVPITDEEKSKGI